MTAMETLRKVRKEMRQNGVKTADLPDEAAKSLLFIVQAATVEYWNQRKNHEALHHFNEQLAEQRPAGK